MKTVKTLNFIVGLMAITAVLVGISLFWSVSPFKLYWLATLIVLIVVLSFIAIAVEKHISDYTANKPKTGIELIAEERKRQIEVEGWTPEHDASHTEGQLAQAGAFYAFDDETIHFINDTMGNDYHLAFWPFDLKWLKRTPDDRIKELQKAGALIAAEIDRLNRI